MTPPGAIMGGVLGWAIFLGAGFTGLAMLGTFFVLGTLATSWKLNKKIKLGLAEANKGRRTAGQALANGGVAGVLGMVSWLLPHPTEVLHLMMAASFAAATADTLSSELGNVHGHKFYNVLTFKPDTRGSNGVISLEGTLLGVLGSSIIAFVYAVGYAWGWPVAWIILAGTIGNFLDSFLGATFERKHYLSNNAVNLLNTLGGALAALIFYLLA